MNVVLLIGKLIKDVEYKFMLERNKSAKAILYLKLLDKTEIKVAGYNEIADFCCIGKIAKLDIEQRIKKSNKNNLNEKAKKIWKQVNCHHRYRQYQYSQQNI